LSFTTILPDFGTRLLLNLRKFLLKRKFLFLLTSYRQTKFRLGFLNHIMKLVMARQ